MARYSGWSGLDLFPLDPDVPIRYAKTDAGRTMTGIISKLNPDKGWTPRDIADFIELVVPELQRRGVMWSEYEGSALREKPYGPGVVRLRDDHPGHRPACRPTRPHTPKVPEAQPAAQGASL